MKNRVSLPSTSGYAFSSVPAERGQNSPSTVLLRSPSNVCKLTVHCKSSTLVPSASVGRTETSRPSPTLGEGSSTTDTDLIELEINVGAIGAWHPPHTTQQIAPMAEKARVIGMGFEPHGDGLKYRTKWLLS